MKCLFAYVLATAALCAAGSDPFEWMHQYSLFVHNDMMMKDVDCQGRVAVGNDANLINYEVGTITPDKCTVYDLVVGNYIDYDAGTIAHGMGAWGDCASKIQNVAHSCTDSCKKNIVPFSTAFKGLISESTKFGNTAANGQTSVIYQNMILSGKDKKINVFKVKSSDLDLVNNITITIPSGAWAFIDVAGQMNSLKDKLIVLDQPNTLTHTLWNFYESVTLEISGTSVQGSVLAPLANVTFTNGNIDGSLACLNLNGNGETHYHPFVPPVNPCPPCPPCQPKVHLPDWEIFVHKNVDLHNVDDQGRFAAGGPVNLTDYAVATKLPKTYAHNNTVVVGGDLVYDAGVVTEGNIVYGGTGDITGVTHSGSILHEKNVIDFYYEFEVLDDLSTNITKTTANGHVVHENKNVIKLEGSNKVNVFNVHMNDNITVMDIACPSDSWALVNILGPGQIRDLQITLDGITNRRVLYNFEQTEVTLTGVSVEGSVLAPHANVTFYNGNVQGQLISNTLYGDGEVHYFPFIPIPGHCPPCPPCPPNPPSSFVYEE